MLDDDKYSQCQQTDDPVISAHANEKSFLFGKCMKGKQTFRMLDHIAESIGSKQNRTVYDQRCSDRLTDPLLDDCGNLQQCIQFFP